MRRITGMLALLAAVGIIGSTHAATGPIGIDALVQKARTSVIVPDQWDGIWSSVDSVYSCAGAYMSTHTSTDTICGGKDFSPVPQNTPISISCTGSANATSFDETCTGSGTILTNCDASYSVVMHGTLSGSTTHIVSVVTITYTGTGCAGLPSSCTQTDSWGTRLGPAPTDYCSTPTKQSTWGQVKTWYR